MDLDDLYQQILSSKIGEITRATQEHIPAIYQGEHAMALMFQCFSIDGFGRKPDMYSYQLKIVRLQRDTLMNILCSLKEVIPGKKPWLVKRSKLNEELKVLGIIHMGKWITSCKDGTFTLHIRKIPYEKGRAICRILFEW